MNWFYAEESAQRGPVSEDEIRQLLASGRINQQTLVWREGMPQWATVSQTELSGVPPIPGQVRLPYASPQPLAYSGAQAVPNYLAQAILVTLFCCMPFGIVAIVYAAQVSPKLTSGDYVGAREASDKARFWCWLAFGIGLATIGVWGFMAIIGGLTA